MSSAIRPAKFSSEWYSKPGVIYFIGAGIPPTAIKIGLTQKAEAKVKQRLRMIQCDNHEPVELLGLLFFTEDVPLLDVERQEHALHARFAKYQRMIDGNVGHEWFTAAPELLDFIADNATPPEQTSYPRSVAKLAKTTG